MATDDTIPAGATAGQAEAQGKPKTLDEILKERTMTPEEQSALEDEKFDELEESLEKDRQEAKAAAADTPGVVKAQDQGDIPPWLVVPTDARFKVPPNKQVAFMLFKAEWTDRPEKGARQCILWPITDAEEKLAIKATRGEAGRTLTEMSKMMIRAIDGHLAIRTGDLGPGNVDRFWDDIGGKCRQMITNYYMKTHALSKEEQADFYANCFAVRAAKVVG
jgi:hypothetical protein